MLPNLLHREESLNLHNKQSLFHVAASAWKSNPNLIEGVPKTGTEQLGPPLLTKQTSTLGRTKKTFSRSDSQTNQSNFEAKVDYFKKRPKGWVQRFVAHVDETHEILPTPRTQEELRELRIERSGWKNTVVTSTDLQRLLPDEPKPVQGKDYFGDRSELCLYCSSKIPVGAELVKCRSCPSISHVNCIPNARYFKKKESVIAAEQRSNPWSPMNLTRPNSPLLPTSRLNSSTNSPRDRLSRPISPNNNSRPETPDKNDRMMVAPLLQRSFSSSKLNKQNNTESSNNLLKKAVANNTNPNGNQGGMNSSFKGNNINTSNTSNNNNKKNEDTIKTKKRPPKSADTHGYHQNKEAATGGLIQSRPTSSSIRTTAFTMTAPSTPQVDPMIIAKELDWTCQFCRNECHAHDRVNKYKQLMAEKHFKKIRSIILVQSFIRMITHRLQFSKAKRGIIRAQQTLRAKWFARKAERERANQRYSYRIRLHDIKVVTKVSTSSSNSTSLRTTTNTAAAAAASATSGNVSNGYVSSNSSTTHNSYGTHSSSATGNYENFDPDRVEFPALPFGHIIGDIPYEKYEKFFFIDHQNKHQQATGLSQHLASISSTSGSVHDTTLSDLTTPSRINSKGSNAVSPISKLRRPSQSNNIFSDHGMHTGSPDHEKHHPLLDFLAHGHTDDPQFAKPFKGGHNLPKGTLFLTVTVHEYEDQPIDKVSAFGQVDTNHGDGSTTMSPIQMFRYDFQLKDTGRVTEIKPAVMKKLGYEDLPAEIIEKLAKQYQMTTFNTSKAYILIPFTRANVEIRLTLSEVKDWPKGVVVGQSRFNVCYHLTRKKVASFHQTMIPVKDDYLLPEADDATRLNLVLPLRPTANGAGVPSYAQASRTAILAKKDDGKQYAQSIFTWTIIAQGNSEFNEVGDMAIAHEEAAVAEPNKLSKYWCVLLDGYLHTFSTVRESVKQRHCIDIRASYVSILPDNAFRVKSSTEILFFVCENQKRFDVWFRKLYSQSLSSHSISYAAYMKRKPQISVYTNHNALRKNIMDELQATTEKNKQNHGKHNMTNFDNSTNGLFTASRRDAVFGTLDPKRSTSSRVWIDMMDAQIEKELVRERNAHIINVSKELPNFKEPSLEEAKKRKEEQELRKSQCPSPFAVLSRNNSGKFQTIKKAPSEKNMRVEAILRASSGRFDASTSAALTVTERFIN